MGATTLLKSEVAPSRLPLVCGYVVTYNGKRFLERCFQTLQRLTDYENFRLILVDNGSSDGSGDYVRETFPAVEGLRVFPNAGIAHAANVAVEDARRRGAKYVTLLHDDIEILHAQWLREAVSHAERDPRIGIISLVEFTTKGGPQPVPESKLADFEYLTSAVRLMPVELFDRIGMYDEVYYLAGDDDDFCSRAQARGYRTVKLLIPVYHFGGGTLPTYSVTSAYLHIRNGIRFCLKNRSAMHALARAVRFLDVACNPWPVTFDNQNRAHLTMRNSGNLAVNLLLWMRAVSWNIIHLPQTYRIRAAERRLIRAARAARKDPAAVSQPSVKATPAGQLNL
jgi:GT2 family glycosyltransferase